MEKQGLLLNADSYLGVSNAGDMNGDGKDDIIIIGAFEALNEAGQAYVIFGDVN